MADLVRTTARGLYCEAGDFFIDPWEPVERAVVTHGHSDHAYPGSGEYVATDGTSLILAKRLEAGTKIVPKAYGEPFTLGRAKVSFHPAGHVLGSAQVRVETKDGVWVVSGDYKRDPDPTCVPFEVVTCDTFITEATFALPIYRWEPPGALARDLLDWWEKNRAAGKASLLFVYALGKAQRVLAELTKLTGRTVYTHGAVENLTEVYRKAGVTMLPTEKVGDAKRDYAGELVLAPPSALGSPWLRRFGELQTGFASGWMRIRGNRRRRGYDRGFTLSDHADWPSLLTTISATQAKRVLVTHGTIDPLVQYLKESGVDAAPLKTTYAGEEGAGD